MSGPRVKGHSHECYSLPIGRPGMQRREFNSACGGGWWVGGWGASFKVSSGQRTPWFSFLFVSQLLPLLFEAFFSLLLLV